MLYHKESDSVVSSSKKAASAADVTKLTPAQENLRKLFLVAMALLLIALLVTSLAVMAQAGIIAASTWVLGSTLTTGFLWLAAHLGMMSLGAPVLIALVAGSAWLLALVVNNWDSDAAALWWSTLAGKGVLLWGGKHSTIFYSGVQTQKEEGEKFAQEVEVLMQDARITMITIFFDALAELALLPIVLLRVYFIYPIGEDEELQTPTPRHPLAIACLLLLNLIYMIAKLPFTALGRLLQSLWHELEAGWGGLKSLASGKQEGYQKLDDEVADSGKSLSQDRQNSRGFQAPASADKPPVKPQGGAPQDQSNVELTGGVQDLSSRV